MPERLSEKAINHILETEIFIDEELREVVDDLMIAVRQLRGDLKYQKELFEACASNLLSMQAQRNAARERERAAGGEVHP